MSSVPPPDSFLRITLVNLLLKSTIHVVFVEVHFFIKLASKISNMLLVITRVTFKIKVLPTILILPQFSMPVRSLTNVYITRRQDM